MQECSEPFIPVRCSAYRLQPIVHLYELLLLQRHSQVIAFSELATPVLPSGLC